MEDYISLGKQLGIKDDGHNQLILHINDIVHNIEIDYMEYYDNAWVYKEYIDDSCIYYEDEIGYIR